jgi:cell division septation protein DedD
MLFDRFSFRERESGMSEEDPGMADLPPETRSYAFTLDTRQIVFLIAGYCFLCVLVFALGVVVGRATTHPETSESMAETERTTPSRPPEQPAQGRPELSTSGRIPLIPAAEPKNPMAQGPEFAFSPSLPESALTSKSESLSATTPPRPKHTPPPEVAPPREPPAITTTTEDKREPEPRRPAVTAENKSKTPTAARVSLSQGGEYTIQVGSSRNLEQATELKGRLSKKGYTAYVQSVELSDKGTWHRVRVGSYRDKEGAERVASDIRSRESLPATVMKR